MWPANRDEVVKRCPELEGLEEDPYRDEVTRLGISWYFASADGPPTPSDAKELYAKYRSAIWKPLSSAGPTRSKTARPRRQVAKKRSASTKSRKRPTRDDTCLALERLLHAALIVPAVAPDAPARRLLEAKIRQLVYKCSEKIANLVGIRCDPRVEVKSVAPLLAEMMLRQDETRPYYHLGLFEKLRLTGQATYHWRIHDWEDRYELANAVGSALGVPLLNERKMNEARSRYLLQVLYDEELLARRGFRCARCHEGFIRESRCDTCGESSKTKKDDWWLFHCAKSHAARYWRCNSNDCEGALFEAREKPSECPVCRSFGTVSGDVSIGWLPRGSRGMKEPPSGSAVESGRLPSSPRSGSGVPSEGLVRRDWLDALEKEPLASAIRVARILGIDSETVQRYVEKANRRRRARRLPKLSPVDTLKQTLLAMSEDDSRRADFEGARDDVAGDGDDEYQGGER